jgi:hypothetical protein
MAAAAFTLAENPATIEADGTGALITNGADADATSGAGERRYEGTLVNGGSATVWIKFSWTSTPATAPALTDAQAQGTIGLPSGASIPILRHYRTFFPKCNATTTTLYWFPNGSRL